MSSASKIEWTESKLTWSTAMADFEEKLEGLLRLIPEDNEPARKAARDLFAEMVDEIEDAKGDVEDRAEEVAEDKIADAVSDMRLAVERPVGKMTFNIVDQRLFDRAMFKLLDDAGINPLGA